MRLSVDVIPSSEGTPNVEVSRDDDVGEVIISCESPRIMYASLTINLINL